MTTPSVARVGRSGFRVAFLLPPILVAAAAIVPLFRQTGVPSWRTLYLEDGTIYYQQAHDHGGFYVLLRGYHGYLQLAPRLLAVPSTLVAVPHLALYFAFVGSVAVALLAWFVYNASAGWIDSRSVRLALASLMALMPVAGYENTANVLDVIWPLAAVAPWALISLRETRPQIVVRSVVAFLASASTPLCFFFVPVALGWAWHRRTRASQIVVGAFLAGLAVQGAVMTRTPGEVILGPPLSTATLARDAGCQVFAVVLIGNQGTTASSAFAAGAVAVVVSLFAAAIVGARRDRQILAAALATLAIPCALVPAYERHIFSLRFSEVPVMLLVSAMAILLATPTKATERDGTTPQAIRTHRVRRAGRAILVAQTVVLCVVCFRVTTNRSLGPDWQVSVASGYQENCTGAPPSRVVRIPEDAFGFVSVSLSCGNLRPLGLLVVGNPHNVAEIILPHPGAIVSGPRVALVATASTTGAAASLSFDLSGGSLPRTETLVAGTSRSSIWFVTWDSGSVPNGTYRLRSQVTTASVGRVTSPSISFTVRN